MTTLITAAKETRRTRHFARRARRERGRNIKRPYRFFLTFSLYSDGSVKWFPDHIQIKDRTFFSDFSARAYHYEDQKLFGLTSFCLFLLVEVSQGESKNERKEGDSVLPLVFSYCERPMPLATLFLCKNK